MHRFSMSIRPCPPGVIPKTTKAALLLEAGNVWDDAALTLHLGEPAEDG